MRFRFNLKKSNETRKQKKKMFLKHKRHDIVLLTYKHGNYVSRVNKELAYMFLF